MRMPGMKGAQFLSKVRQSAPDCAPLPALIPTDFAQYMLATKLAFGACHGSLQTLFGVRH
jgi:CheY-like chemotaxis protein